jgi:DNA-binding transcriptional LysR family regulator
VVVDVRLLEAFSAVVRHGSVSAAARALYLSQPAVTQAISSFERSMDARLLTRSAKGVVLTEAGRVAAARVERALGHIREALVDVIRASRVQRRPSLRAATVARLAAVVAVTEEGGFSGAARSIGAARSTVHRTARQFERMLGVALFEETSHGVRSTRDAERLVLRIRLAGAEVEQAQAEVAATRGLEQGETVIGAMPLARSHIVPAAVLETATDHPRHVIRLLDGPYPTLLRELRTGRADVLVGALRPTVPADVVQERLFDDPLAVIVRAGHPLAAVPQKAPSFSALSKLAWVAPSRGAPLRRHFDGLMARFPQPPPAAPIESNSLVAARAILLASDRAMLLSAHQVEQDVMTGQLVTLPHPLGRVVRPIGLTMRRDWFPTEVQRELLQHIRRQGRLASAAAPKMTVIQAYRDWS